MRDAGGELAERGQLLGLHQAILRGAEIVERLRQLARARLHLLEQLDVLDRDHGLIGEGVAQLDLLVGERTGLPRVMLMTPMTALSPMRGTTSRLRQPRARATAAACRQDRDRHDIGDLPISPAQCLCRWSACADRHGKCRAKHASASALTEVAPTSSTTSLTKRNTVVECRDSSFDRAAIASNTG